MKLCIPSEGRELESMVGEHFGRTPYYIIFDTDTRKAKVIPNTSRHMGGGCYPPELIKREGVSVLLCKNLGRRALSMFEEFGIEVFIGAQGTVRQTIELFEKGKLKKAEENLVCKGKG